MLNVGIFLFDNVELLDFAGPYEVFSVASELHNYSLFKVFTVSQYGREIKSVNGLRIQPDFSFSDHHDIDILVIPGGIGSATEMHSSEVLDWVYQIDLNSQITMSVCSGARILGKIGLLDHQKCTTHHEVLDHLREIAPKAMVKSDERFIDNGHLSTSAGISAGIDLSLHIVEKSFSKAVADKTRVYMEYGEWENLR